MDSLEKEKYGLNLVPQVLYEPPEFISDTDFDFKNVIL